HLMDSDYFLCRRVTYELLLNTWAKMKGGPYLDRMNSIPKLVASRTLTGPLAWNATLIKGDVAEEIAKLKQEPGKDIEMYGSAALMQTLMAHNLIDEYRIWVHPFVIGRGTRLFTEAGRSSKAAAGGHKTAQAGGGDPALAAGRIGAGVPPSEQPPDPLDHLVRTLGAPPEGGG